MGEEKKNPESPEILVVDDTLASLQLLSQILNEHGYRVRPATSGYLALRSVAAKAPDLILLDVKMPELDGFEVCRRLKAEERSREIPVLFISALGESAEKIKGFAAGGLDYISKPFVAEEVLARVGIHLRLKAFAAQLEEKVRQRTADLTAANRRLLEEGDKSRRMAETLLFTQFAVDSSAEAIFWIKKDGSISYANQAACVLLGYSRQDFLRLMAFSLNPEHQGAAWPAHWEELRQEGILRLECLIARKDGVFLPVEITANYVEFNGEEFNCAFAHDISERKQTQAALLDSNERFKAFMDYAPFYAYVKDASLHHLFANKKTLELIAVAAPEEIKLPNFFAEELAQKIETADRSILAGASDFEELEYQTPMAGKNIWLRDIKFPIILSDGTRLVGGVALDISEPIRAEEELRRSAQEWSAAMDASEDVVYLLDRQRRVIRANKSFYRLTRSTPEIARGQHIVALVHPDGEKVPCPVCQAQEELRDLVLTMEPDHPDNPAARPIEISLKIVRNDEGQPLSMLMTLHDLTHERKIQEELSKYRAHLEELVKVRTGELESKNAELQKMNKLFVGRELRMVELKEKIKELENNNRV